MPCSLPITLFVTKSGGHVPWHRKCPAQPEECSGAPHCWVVLSGLRSFCMGMGWT